MGKERIEPALKYFLQIDNDLVTHGLNFLSNGEFVIKQIKIEDHECDIELKVKKGDYIKIEFVPEVKIIKEEP